MTQVSVKIVQCMYAQRIGPKRLDSFKVFIYIYSFTFIFATFYFSAPIIDAS